MSHEAIPWDSIRLKFLYTRSNAGEVIAKDYWTPDGKNTLYTCKRTVLRSDYNDFAPSKRTGANDILVTRNGTPYVHLPKRGSIYSNVVQRLRLKPSLNRRFIRYALDHSALTLTGAGIGIESFSMDRWNELSLPIPPLATQHTIANFLDQKTAAVDELIGKKERLIELLEEKRTALINRAVTKGVDPEVPMERAGVPWIGEIPENWDVVSLRHLAKIQTGLTKGRNLDGYDTVRMPYLRVANVQDGYLDLSEIKEIELKRDEVEQYLVRDGDVLMNEGGDFDKLGRGTVWRAEIDRCVHQNHVFVVRPNRLLSSEWLTHFSQAHVAKHYFILAGNQTTNLASISASNLKALPVLLPPASEQKTITRYLAGRLAKLGRIKQIIAEQAGRLKEYRQSLITAAVTGQIDIEQNWQKS